MVLTSQLNSTALPAKKKLVEWKIVPTLSLKWLKLSDVYKNINLPS
jgi:hypothetical protein